MPELKPCPFCGGEAEVFIADDFCEDDMYYVECTVCGASTLECHPLKDDAIKDWNEGDGKFIIRE